MGRRATGVPRASRLARWITIAWLLATPLAARAQLIVFHEDFSSMPFGPWTAPPSAGYTLRGPMFTEYPIQADGTVGPVLSTRGLFAGERVVFPVWVDGAQKDMQIDVDFQRIAAIVDSAVMWHVNIDPSSGAQRYYQAALLHGAKPGVSPTLRIQYIEENPNSPRGFEVTTLAETHGPTITPDGWHHLQVRSEGAGHDDFVVRLDDTDLLSARDTRISQGHVGLRVGMDLTRWDNLNVAVTP